MSMAWFKRKSTPETSGNHRFSNDIWGFNKVLTKNPLNQAIGGMLCAWASAYSMASPIAGILGAQAIRTHVGKVKTLLTMGKESGLGRFECTKLGKTYGGF